MPSHLPNADAVNDVILAFANAPVPNPDGTTGISLHVQVNESAVAENANLAFEPCTGPAPGGTPDFDGVKNASFGTAAERAAGVNVTNAKRFGFRYALYAHNLLGLGGTSGCAELPGNDFVVSLGSWTSVGGHGVGTRDEQAGTLMHELGHNVNLRHGGLDNVNCKPNYLSVMSYSRQISGNPIPGRPLDYSRASLATLDETNLSEPAGIGGPVGNRTAFGPPPALVVPSSGAIDWNRDGDSADAGVAVNINNLGPGSGCGGFGAMLQGYNDWGNLKYDFQNTTDFADGVHLSVLEVDEITVEEAAVLEVPDDHDHVPPPPPIFHHFKVVCEGPHGVLAEGAAVWRTGTIHCTFDGGPVTWSASGFSLGAPNGGSSMTFNALGILGPASVTATPATGPSVTMTFVIV